ncbi:ABC transporter permease [Streptomyces sp. SPB162]|uniref:ABC transporter permease n=1 Tax=Streptomyces sp. SPB162 TaxID=2940560 RepID=UPI002406D9BB|nr:ABC transporter permease [Streptomyces sp. SPB162]MDF9815706.1 ABC-2 type transport system permease protein [Streptomyces sp. SPB162]
MSSTTVTAPASPSHLLSDTALIFNRYLRQTVRSRIGLVFGLLMPLLYLVFFGPLLQGLPLGGAGDAWQTLVPGLLIQLGLFSAVFCGFGILIEKQLGIVERMRVTPVSRLALLLGRTLKDVLQLVMQSLVLVLAAVAMGLRTSVTGAAIGFLFTGLLTISLASLSYALAMRVDSPQEFAPIINTVNVPAMLLSGLLLPMSLAPGWLDALSRFVPFRYFVDAVRAAFVGDYWTGTVGVGALVAVGFAAVSVTVGTRVFTKAGA